MLANNVRESTTTTGTGDKTLDGAISNGRTIFSQIGLNRNFDAVVRSDNNSEFENGSYYLSSANTLVRNTVFDSSNGGNPVDFSAGTKQVIISATTVNVRKSDRGFSNRFGFLRWMGSSNHISNNTTRALQANQIVYIPVRYDTDAVISTLGVRISNGSGASSDNLYVGLYERDPITGDPSRLIMSATDFDPSVSGNQARTVGSQRVEAGWYFVGIWSDVTPTLRACNSQFGSIPYPATAGTFDASNLCFYRHDSQTGLTNLPSTPTTLVPVINSPAPLIYIGVP